MRIDSHLHFWHYVPEAYPWISGEMPVLKNDYLPRHIRNILAENNFDGCVAVQAMQSESENEFLLTQSESDTLVKGIVGWVDLRADNLEERLEYYKTMPLMKGFRHIVEVESPGFMLDTKFIRGVKLLVRFGFTYDLLVYHKQLEETLKFVDKVGDVKIVLDHIGKPSIRTREKTSWELNLAALATFPNISCKVSGMVTEALWKAWKKEDFFPFLDEVAEAFGPQRMIYGSDWPVCLLSATFEQQLEIVEAYISSWNTADKEAIMGNNAAKFYNLH